MKATTKETIRIYLDQTKRHPFAVFLIVTGAILATSSSLYRPIILKNFIDTLSSGRTDITGELINLVFQVLLAGLGIWVGWRMASFTASKMVARILPDILNLCFNYLHNHSYNFFNNSFVGSLVAKVNRYARSYEKIFDQITWNIGPTIITIIVILAVLFQRFPLLGLIVLIWAIIYTYWSYRFVHFKMKYDLQSAEAETKTTAHLADTITNQLNLKLFSDLKTESRSFYRITDKLHQTYRRAWFLDSTAEAIQSSFLFILEFAILYAAVRLWEQGMLTIGDFVLIQGFLLQIFHHLWGVGKYLRKIYEGLADAEEMTEILLTPHEIVDTPRARTLKVEKGSIAYRNVDFTYHGKKNVLNDFNLTIQPGERIALIGQSGGGKTTIIKLLFRFFDIQGGEILIDGQNIAQVTQESLRRHLALVPQEPVLFHRTLMENIRYARPGATNEEVIRAAKLAHCHEFISSLPDQYQTFVGERGVKLSGGERQRVAIARAILKDAPILVLDEATSSLDSESERYIQAALANLMKDRTTIVVAHRLSTIMQMDRIIVIGQGKIIEEGTHNQLLELKKGTYQKLWEIQAGGFSQP